LFDLNEKEFRDLHEVLRMAAEAVQNVYKPKGMNFGMNHGAAAGAGIPEHIHYHIVPRWAGDLNFFPLLTQTKVVIETAQESYLKYKKYFKKKRSLK
jgi:ATP adenylyltransferase